MFVLTDSSASKLYGFCRRFPQVGSEDTSECLVFLSQAPLFSILEPALEIIQTRWILAPWSVLTVVQQLRDKKVPAPGSFLNLSLTPRKAVLKRDFQDRVSLRLLFQSLSIDNVLWVLNSILFESRIILTSYSLSILSACAHAFLALMEPFSWPHIFIPILPASITHYACAPMPFIVGIHKDCLKDVLEMPLDSVTIVDLDTDSISVRKLTLEPTSPRSSAQGFAGNAGSRLKKRLASIVPNSRSIRQMGKDALKKLQKGGRFYSESKFNNHVSCFSIDLISQQIYDAVLSFFIHSMGHWIRCFEIEKSLDAFRFSVHKFVTDSIADSQETFNFLQTICQSQYFTQFLSDKASAFQVRSKSGLRISEALSGLSPPMFRFVRLCEVISAEDILSFS